MCRHQKKIMTEMGMIRTAWGVHKLAGLLVVMGVLVLSDSFAEEITPMAFTGFEGHVSFRYLFDEQESGQVDSVKSKESRPTFEEEVFLLGHGYWYHPKLVKFDIGGGPLFTQTQYETNAGKENYSDTLYNFIVRLSFLEDKSTPFSLFHEHLNPSVSAGLTERYLQEHDRYGFNFTIREPLSPVLMSLSASRNETNGEGFEIITHDITDQAVFRAHSSLGTGGYIQLTHNWLKQDSESGNPAFVIQPSSTETNTTDLATRVLFGDENEGRWTNNISYSVQDQQLGDETQPTRWNARFSPDIRWDHSENWSSLYRYNYNRTSEQDIETQAQDADIGAIYVHKDRLTADAHIVGEKVETNDFVKNDYGVRGAISYLWPYSWGSLRVGAAGHYNGIDQQADQVVRSVFGENIILVGTTPVALTNSFVVPGSVIVSNLTRTQIYVEGLDYLLTVVGSRTRVQRILVGNILDGETVLVDYNYETGGTVTYINKGQSYQTNLNLFRMVDLFARYRQQEQNIIEGESTIILNPVRNTEYGINASFQFWQDWLIGAGAVYTNNDEEIAPYNRQAYDGYVQVPLPLTSSIRFSGRRVITDNLDSPEDMDLRGYGARFRTRPWRFADIGMEGDYEEDTGGSVLRERWSRRFFIDWRIRQLTIAAQAGYTREVQANFERERTIIRAVIRRDL